MQKLLSPRIPAIAVLFTIAFFLTTIFPREIFFEVEKKCKEVPCDSSITCPSISTARSPPAVTIQEPCHSIDLKTAFSGVVDFDPLHAGYWQAQQGQDKYVYETFFRRRPELQGKGVFVEFGAEDGVFNSNTYFFEKVLKWRGVLVEFVEAEYNKIAANRPGSIAVYGAVGARDGETTMSVIDIPGWSGDGQSMHDKRRPENARTMTVPMHRLETILERAGITHVNYMTVDTEGSEAAILKTIDLDKIRVDVIQVEHLHFPDTAAEDAAKRQDLEALMRSKGYALHAVLKIGDDTDDLVFVRAPEGVDEEAFQSAKQHFKL